MTKATRDFRSASIVMACFLGLSVSISTILLAPFPIFFGALSAEFGWTRGQLSFAFAVAGLSIAVASPVVGHFAARHGVRRILQFAIPAFAVVVATIPLATGSFWMFVAWMALAGLIGAASNSFVYLSILPGWFTDRLGLMLGVAMTGVGIGQAAAPVLSQYLIETLGWRGAYAGLGLASFVIAYPAAVLFIRERPGDGKVAAHHDADRHYVHGGSPTGWRNSSLWFLGISFFLIAFSASGTAVHSVPVLRDRGITAQQAAMIGSLGGVALLFARLATGYLLDRIDVRLIGAFNALCAIAAPLLLAGWSGQSIVVLAPIFAGLAIGAEGDLMPYLVRRFFGLANYAAVYSRLFMFYSIGVLLGPLTLGAAFDHAGSYDAALVLCGGGAFLALGLFLFVNQPRFRPDIKFIDTRAI